MALTRESTVIYSTPPGKFAPYGGGSVPSGWLLCDGTAVSRATYAILFAAIGTAYGAGDGSTTFNLPDCRTNVVPGYKSGDANFGTLGGTGGAASVTLSSAQIPAHGHPLSADTAGTPSGTVVAASAGTPSGSVHVNVVGTGGLAESHILTSLSGAAAGDANAANDIAGATFTGSPLGTHGHTFTGSPMTNHSHTVNNNTGGGGSHTNLQPFVTANYIIKY